MSFQNIFRLTVAVVCALVFSTSSRAALVGVDSAAGLGFGTVVVQDVVVASDNLSNNGTRSADNTLFLLGFGTQHQLSANYNVEHNGSSGSNIRDAQTVPGTLNMGRAVNVFQIRHDRATNPTASEQMTVTFSTKILGLNGGQTNQGGVNHLASYTEFNTLGAAFQAGGGTFDFAGNDFVLSISSDRRTMIVRSQVGNSLSSVNNFDQLWVITAYVPEPTTAVLGLMGIAGLVARRRRAA